MKLIPVSAALLAAAITLAAAASAASPELSLPPPPLGNSAAAADVFGALMAVARAAVTSPGTAQRAGQTYTKAVQQYNAGDYAGAQASSQEVLRETAAYPQPQPSLYPLLIPQPAFYAIANPSNIDEAYAAGNLSVAHQAMTLCGAPGATPPPVVAQQFASAVNAMLTQQWNATSTAAAYVITACGTATHAYAATVAALPHPAATPIPMGTYSPLPIATLIPDPALKQTK